MARCKHCEKGGLFQKLNKEGLCKTCDPVVTPDIETQVNVIYEAMHVYERAQDDPQKLSALDELLAAARHLQQYESKGLDTCSPPPTPVLEEYSGFRDELLKTMQG